MRVVFSPKNPEVTTHLLSPTSIEPFFWKARHQADQPNASAMSSLTSLRGCPLPSPHLPQELDPRSSSQHSTLHHYPEIVPRNPCLLDPAGKPLKISLLF